MKLARAHLEILQNDDVTRHAMLLANSQNEILTVAPEVAF